MLTKIKYYLARVQTRNKITGHLKKAKKSYHQAPNIF